MSITSSLTKYKGTSLLNSKNDIQGLLDIDRIKNNPVYQCTLSGGRFNVGGVKGTKSIVGIYNSDAPFTISSQSNWEDTFEMPQVVDKLSGALNWVENMAGKTQFILKSLRMTEKRWTGSSAPTFSITIDIPIVRKKDAPWTVVKYVMQAVSGTMNDYNSQGQVTSAEDSFQIFAPNGYGVTYAKGAKDSDVPKGTYTVSLGSGSCCWFRMQNAVITSASCNIGSKKYYDGNPTFVSVSIGFEFWRQPLLEDIITWFPLAQSDINPF